MESLFLSVITIKKSRTISDVIGMTLSLVCAIQCAIAPILLSIAPIIPKWAHFGHGWVWISLILIIAIWSIGRGFMRHQSKSVVIVAMVGIGFLLAGTFLEGRLTIVIESLVFVIGGLLLTFAHYRNFKLEKARLTQ